MRRRVATVALAAALVVAGRAEAVEEGPFAGLDAVDAGAFVSLFSEVCLEGLPGFEAVDNVLGHGGFGVPDAAGFRLHGRRAFAAMAVPASEASAAAAPMCMVMAPDVPFDEARAALAPRLEARAEDLTSAESQAIDLPHRVWRWEEDERRIELVLSRDGQGNLGAVIAVPSGGDGF